MSSRFKDRLGTLAVIMAVILPAAIWLTLLPLGLRFDGYGATTTSIGQLSGLLGAAIFAVNLIMGARIRFLEPFFGGLNRIYLAHHRLGAVALGLILAHPLSLALNYLTFSLQDAVAFLLPSIDAMPKTWGSLALYLAALLLVLTFFFRPRYDIWKKGHAFLGLAFLFAVLHMLTIPSDISRSAPLRNYMLSLALLGLAASIYRSVLKRRTGKSFIVESIIRRGDSIFDILLKPEGKALDYRAGQFVFISFLDNILGKESHPFSIASTPNSGKIRIAAKKLGDYTSRLDGLKPDIKACVEGPFGTFFAERFGNKQVWVGAGIGITPFLGMSNSLKNNADAPSVLLFYCTRSAEDAVFLTELEEIARGTDKLKLVPYFSSISGRLDAKKIKEYCSEIGGRDFLLCGPPTMMKSLERQLIGQGVKKNRIYFEAFEL